MRVCPVPAFRPAALFKHGYSGAFHYFHGNTWASEKQFRGWGGHNNLSQHSVADQVFRQIPSFYNLLISSGQQLGKSRC